MPIPHSMHAMQIVTPGADGVLEVVAQAAPNPQAGEVLIAVRAIGVNRADLFQLQGSYPLPDGASHVPGLEVSGQVVSVGEGVTRLQPGDAVMALTDGGAYAEYVTTHEALCFSKPEPLSWTHAAALPEALFTNWMVMQDKAQLKKGERVLIYGGTSGIGSIGIQMAHIWGAEVCATASTDEKAAYINGLGATAVQYHATSLVDAVKAWSGGKGVDVILDMVGGERAQDNMAMAAPCARIVTIALLQGNQATLRLGAMLVKQLHWMGALLRPQPLERKAEYAAGIRQHILPALQEARIQPLIDSHFSLQNAAKALEKMRRFDHIGKIVLEV